MTPETYEVLEKVMQTFGWPGLFACGVVWCVRWWVLVKYPQDRQDRLNQMAAEAGYRAEWLGVVRGLSDEVRILSLMFNLEYPQHRRTLEANGVRPPKSDLLP